jgi:26S proteasome regulatory subunit N6
MFDGYRQLETKSYRPALQLIESLLKELRKLDDKMILTEVHLLESRVNHATKNMPKAKVRCLFLRTNVSSTRTIADVPLVLGVFVVGFDLGKNGGGFDLLPTALTSSVGFPVWNAPHRGPGLQDWVSSTSQHATISSVTSRDTHCACGIFMILGRYSYFFETFEGFAGQDDDRALPALKYMCLCKIMMNLVSPDPLTI